MNDPLPVASLLRRLAALIYDAFLMFAITLAYATLMLIVKIIFNGTDNLESIQPGPALQWLSLVGLLISLGGYYFICWRKQGQTLGMKAWRLRLQRHDGNLASPFQCIKRSVLATLSLVAGGIGYLWILWPSNSGCLHDILTDTDIVVVPKEK